ncbi:MAG TPA: NAD kinase [Tenuifilaceae bacterium]|nr:NAD kinase [Tenuifilaceae bacterium]
MIIALYGRTVGKEHAENIRLMFSLFAMHNVKLMVYAPLADFLQSNLGIASSGVERFNTPPEVKGKASLMLSLGGDGTFLESVSYVEDSEIPVAGINFGRLGFLAHITSENMATAIEQLVNGDFSVEKRSALHLSIDGNSPLGFPYALNDITIQKKGVTMITINAHIDGEFLCTYWADGLIVSTPTGSTAYSLSVGGPIVSPKSNAFAISPISPHNLTLRPLIIPDCSELTFEVDTREKEILISLDSRSINMPGNSKVKIVKAPFCVGIVNLKDTGYFKTLRNKLMWGIDSRNPR